MYPPNLWDTKAGRLICKSTLAVKNNIVLDKIRVDINRHYQEAIQTDGFAADKVKNSYLGLGVKQDTFLALFSKHNQDFSKKVGYNRAQGTYSKYCILYKHIKSYIKQEYKRDNIFLKELDLAFINGFEHYLRTERECSTNTIWLYMIGVKHIVAIARNSGQLTVNPFAGYLIEDSAVFISRTYVGYFPFMASLPFERQKPCKNNRRHENKFYLRVVYKTKHG